MAVEHALRSPQAVIPRAPFGSARALALMTAKIADHRFFPADSQLVTTKLSRPPTPANLVGSARILELATMASQRLLTLIRAPCGYGKTTAAALLAEQFALLHKVGWVSFDLSDNNPDLGPSYILHALRRMGLNELDWEEGLAAQSLSGNTVPLARVVINALANRAEEYFLFLEDFDRMRGDGSASFVNYLLINAPANLHLIITCQARPRLPLPYLRLRDALYEVPANALKFSPAETQQLLTAQGGLRKDQIFKLHAAMDGWAVAIKLGALALMNNAQSINDFDKVINSGQWLAEYLEENIFDHLPADIQSLLLKCSIVDRVSAPLAACLSGDENAPRIVAWLSEESIYLEPRDFRGEWYRVHPVFREFLLARLRQSGQDRDLHRAAARFFAGHDQPVEAMRHALAAGDTDLALDCLELLGMRLVESSNITTLLEWIALLPREGVVGRIRLSVAWAWALALTGRREVVEVIEEIRQHISANPEYDTPALATEIAGIRSLHAAIVQDDWDTARDLATTYLKQVGDLDSFAARSVRNTAAMCSTLVGDLARARELLRPTRQTRDQDEPSFAMAYRQYVLSFGCSIQGHFVEAERIARCALERCEADGGRLAGSAAMVACIAARYAYERNDLREAGAILRGRLPIIDEVCFPDAAIMAYRTEVGIRLVERDTKSAIELIEHAEALANERSWDRLNAACAALRARMNLPQMLDLDAIDAGVDWANAHNAHPLSQAARMTQTVAEAIIIAKRERGDFEGAWRAATHCLLLTRRSGIETLKFKMLEADALSRMRRADEADHVLADIIKSAAAFGAVRSILDSAAVDLMDGFDERPAYQDLTRPEQAHFAAVMAARAPMHQSVIGDARPKPVNLFDLMTKRELDILAELAAGLSNKEIARRVSMTPETVKWHVRNILRKLDAETRGRAVHKAIAMGLSVVS